MPETPRKKPQVNIEEVPITGKGRKLIVHPQADRPVTVTNIPIDDFRQPLQNESTHLRIPPARKGNNAAPTNLVDADTKMFKTAVERNLALQKTQGHLPGKLEDNLRMLLSKKKSR